MATAPSANKISEVKKSPDIFSRGLFVFRGLSLFRRSLYRDNFFTFFLTRILYQCTMPPLRLSEEQFPPEGVRKCHSLRRPREFHSKELCPHFIAQCCHCEGRCFDEPEIGRAHV